MCDSACFITLDHWTKALDDGSQVDFVFFDFVKAFNTLSVT